jgi:hypothetical protein
MFGPIEKALDVIALFITSLGETVVLLAIALPELLRRTLEGVVEACRCKGSARTSAPAKRSAQAIL